MCRRSKNVQRKGGENGVRTRPYPEESSFRDFLPSVPLPVLVDLVENPIVFLGPVVGQCPGATPQPFAPWLPGRNGFECDFYLLTFGYTRFFVEFNDLAMNGPINPFGHDSTL